MFTTPQANRAYDRLEKALLRERIHHTRKVLALEDQERLEIHLRLSNHLQRHDWDKVDQMTYSTMETTFQLSTNRQKNKYERCLDRNPPRTRTLENLHSDRTVINLSNRQLSEGITGLLAKGGNFAITPRNIPREDIIANLESAIRVLPEDAAEDIRRDAAKILRSAKPPRCNITVEERNAIKELNADKSIIVLRADKGNATVVMNTADYNRKITDLLDLTTYKTLPKDPTNRCIRLTNQMIKNSDIGEEDRKRLITSEAVPPRLYGLPKIHKEGVPLRPIVSAIGSPTERLARYLASLLQPLTGNTTSYIKDSTHFVEQLSDIKLAASDLLVSFDVVSLFTKVPVRETTQLIGNSFPDNITNLFRHCLTTTYFQWNNTFYEQVEGVAMGSPLSPVVANFYMEWFEQRALDTANKRPTVWYRYVDDTFVVWKHGKDELNKFLDHLNGIHSNIQFTMEIEKEGKLPFLDVLVYRKDNGDLGHTVYRKPTHTDRYLNKASNHHPKQKRGLIKTLMERAKRVCEPEHLQAELQHLEGALASNGFSRSEIKRAINPRREGHPTRVEPAAVSRAFLPYIPKVTDRIGKLLDKHNVKTIYRPTRKIQESLRSAKDQRDPLATPGVYRIPCTCGHVYIGTTKRSVKTRVEEHKRCCRLGQVEKSAIAEHSLLQDNHRIEFANAQVIDTTSHYHTRLHREAIEIHKHKQNFNKKEETLRVNKVWTPVLKNTKILNFKQTKSVSSITKADDKSRGVTRPDINNIEQPTSERPSHHTPHQRPYLLRSAVRSGISVSVGTPRSKHTS